MTTTKQGPPEAETRPTVLIVDDDDAIRTQMKWALRGEYDLLEAADRPSAIALVVEKRPAVVTLDLGLPPAAQDVQEGFALLDEIHRLAAGTKVVVVTGRDERRHALEAVARGAYDYFWKPIEIDELKVVLRRALHLHGLEHEHAELQQRTRAEEFEGLLGTSPEMQAVYESIRRVATTDAPVLIVGESGTGKELTAQAIHRRSARKDGPFSVINCGAIPENLLESELFGHERGAFTGAHTRRPGRIESANGGTLFLDEIGELPLSLQVKLLRFLQEHTIERVGGRSEIPVDVRIIAATNRELEREMAGGRFREDLYYRLAVVTIALPPLRERGEDIALLATAFCRRYAEETGRRIDGFDRQALRAMQTHGWPGNVRELDNRVKRAVIMAKGRRLRAADLELDSSFSRHEGLGLREAREELERELVERALVRTGGNVTQAAKELRVSRPTLYELMDKLGLRNKS